MSNKFFAPAFGLTLSANAGNQLPQHDSDNKICAEQYRIISVIDNQREARRQKEEIPCQCAKRSGQKHRSTPDEECEQDDHK